jgi:hypothetical protein
LSVPHRKHITSPLQVQQVNGIYRFMTIVYINITTRILDIIHRAVFYFKQHVSETEYHLRSQEEPTTSVSTMADKSVHTPILILLSYLRLGVTSYFLRGWLPELRKHLFSLQSDFTPSHLTLHYVMIPIFREQHQIRISSLCRFFQPPANPSLLGRNFLPSANIFTHTLCIQFSMSSCDATSIFNQWLVTSSIFQIFSHPEGCSPQFKRV